MTVVILQISWGIDALGTVIVEAELEDGTVGIGTSIGGVPSCYLIEEHFARFVEGQVCVPVLVNIA